VSVRVYLPATVPVARVWLDAGTARSPRGFAVTPALREWYREGNEEELEYVAQTAAARAALELLAADTDAARRRVVLAVDVPDADVVPLPADDRAAVAVGVPVPRQWWASALVDDEEADAVVSAAVTALSAAPGDDDAAFALDEADATELGWYAVQELPHLLG
jgi:hypothetical protein